MHKNLKHITYQPGLLYLWLSLVIMYLVYYILYYISI